jgi:DNA-directed RNA polymerase subunit RPC12/RpoP
MIIFRCVTCGNDIEVSLKSIGKKGKCPICSSINVVPGHSKNKLIFDETEIKCKNPVLQKVCDHVSSLIFPESIITSRITTDANGVDLVLFNIRVGDNERKQAVTLTLSPPLEGVTEERLVYVSTEIGNLKDATTDDLLQALKKVADFWSLNLHVDENHVASLNYSVPLGSVNIPRVARAILVIGWVADTLEAAVLGTDEH